MDIIVPAPNATFGPGYQWRAISSFIGPIETGSYFDVTAFPAVGETEIGKAVQEATFAEAIGILGHQVAQGQDVWDLRPQVSGTATGQPARLQVQLRDPRHAILDQTTDPITWSLDAQSYVLQNQLVAPVPVGGFNASDRSNLELTLAAVRASLPPALTGGPNITFGVIDLLRGPPRSMLRRFGSVLISGRGALSAVPPGALHSFGGTWSIQTLPAGYGRDDGVVVEYHRRLGQFVVLRDEVTSDLYIDVLEDSHWSDNFILWQFPNPIQIQYDIAPGVVLFWQWLI